MNCNQQGLAVPLKICTEDDPQVLGDRSLQQLPPATFITGVVKSNSNEKTPDSLRLNLKVFSKQNGRNVRSFTPLMGTILITTQTFQEKNGSSLSLKRRTHFAITFQAELNKQVLKHSRIFNTFFKELMEPPWNTEHLVNFVKVHFLKTNHFPGVFLKKN